MWTAPPCGLGTWAEQKGKRREGGTECQASWPVVMFGFPITLHSAMMPCTFKLWSKNQIFFRYLLTTAREETNIADSSEAFHLLTLPKVAGLQNTDPKLRTEEQSLNHILAKKKKRICLVKNTRVFTFQLGINSLKGENVLRQQRQKSPVVWVFFCFALSLKILWWQCLRINILMDGYLGGYFTISSNFRYAWKFPEMW